MGVVRYSCKELLLNQPAEHSGRRVEESLRVATARLSNLKEGVMVEIRVLHAKSQSQTDLKIPLHQKRMMPLTLVP